jgi:hypothetical protein
VELAPRQGLKLEGNDAWRACPAHIAVRERQRDDALHEVAMCFLSADSARFCVQERDTVQQALSCAGGSRTFKD